jgi:hypothetical protein
MSRPPNGAPTGGLRIANCWLKIAARVASQLVTPEGSHGSRNAVPGYPTPLASIGADLVPATARLANAQRSSAERQSHGERPRSAGTLPNVGSRSRHDNPWVNCNAARYGSHSYRTGGRCNPRERAGDFFTKPCAELRMDNGEVNSAKIYRAIAAHLPRPNVNRRGERNGNRAARTAAHHRSAQPRGKDPALGAARTGEAPEGSTPNCVYT